MLCVSGVYLRGITNTFVFNFAHACESAEVCSSCWSYSWRLQSVFQDWSRDVVRSRRFSLSQLHPSTDVYILCQNRHRKSAKCSDHIRSWNFGTHSLLVSGFQRCVLASHFVSSVSEGTFLYILFSSGAPYPPTLPPPFPLPTFEFSILQTKKCVDGAERKLKAGQWNKNISLLSVVVPTVTLQALWAFTGLLQCLQARYSRFFLVRVVRQQTLCSDMIASRAFRKQTKTPLSTMCTPPTPTLT